MGPPQHHTRKNWQSTFHAKPSASRRRRKDFCSASEAAAAAVPCPRRPSPRRQSSGPGPAKDLKSTDICKRDVVRPKIWHIMLDPSIPCPKQYEFDNVALHEATSPRYSQ